MIESRPFFKGMTYGWGASRGAYRQPYAAESLQRLAETGSEWIALSFWTYQEDIHATMIPFDYGYTMTDRDIACSVQQARALGLKVCLKPVVNSRDGQWRAYIGFPDGAAGERQWETWFASYTDFICHYAELAEELGCEMLCIGCEMVRTEKHERRWRELIARVRAIYTGPITYNANHGKEEGIAWFDAVDYIGTSAYYPVADRPQASLETMLARWAVQVPRLATLSHKFGKPIIFMEIGCRSARGCAAMPWDFEHTELPRDAEEQANFYRSALQTFWEEPWFAGFFWWDWSVRLYPLEEAASDRGFDIYGKPAGEVLRAYYRGLPGDSALA